MSEKLIKKRSIDNPYITDNLLYGDPIIEQFYPSSRIIYNNVNGLDLYTRSVALETMCDYMYMNNVNVAYISEKNARRIHDAIIQCLVSSENFGRYFK